MASAALDAQAQCGNPIACENALVGNPQSEWDLPGADAGDPTLQGFSTDISVNRGQTINFKISTTAASYRIDIYRLGYYAGLGARKITSITPTASLAQNQPQCLTDAATGLIDCGSWRVSASWAVPSNATSGVYIARLVRPDTNGASHITFIVRDDTGGSDILLQTSDTTWQAYNTYGGNSLYQGTGPGQGLSNVGRAYKVSYNRPDNTRVIHDGLLTFEHPLIRWLEANGYNVSYASGVDTDRRGVAALTPHKIFMTAGHDEYWSGGQRSTVESARAAGVNLAFFAGNLMFWKTRFENSIDGTNTPYRTMTCYKETHEGAKIDPSGIWTGTWRDPRFSPPADGGRPENAITGCIFTANAWRYDPLHVTAEQGRLRFWRNTGFDTLADGEIGMIADGILGNEWDEDLDNGFRPPGIVDLSSTTIPVYHYILDYGSLYGAGIGTHKLTLYRHSSGALVFAAATEQWSWFLNTTHDVPGLDPTYILQHPGPAAPDPRVQQATVNLFADMNVQPTTLQAGLVAATASSDNIAPTSAVVIPVGFAVPPFTPFTIYGTSSDLGGGRVAGVELSLDGGSTWHPANGTTNWSVAVTSGGPGSFTIKSRAVDDSGHIETIGAGTSITIEGLPPGYCLWTPDVIPQVVDEPDTKPVELGVRFSPNTDGWVTALRFYKSAANTGTHIGNLWTNNGTLLATVTFNAETASGWQQASLTPPVPITAGTTYVASYHTDAGHYSDDVAYFTGKGVINPPLSAPADGVAGPNGVFKYGPSAFPTGASQTNYWVDVVFSETAGLDITPPIPTAVAPEPGTTKVSPFTSITAQFNEDLAPSTITSSSLAVKDAQNNAVQGAITYDPAAKQVTLQPIVPLSGGSTYTVTLKGGATGISDVAGNKLTTDVAWSFTTGPLRTGQLTLWPPTAVPIVLDEPDPNPVELGVRFQSEIDGWITALRFYKSAGNTGNHIGNLWTNDGSLLASVAYTGETASGWQQAQLPLPIPIVAGTIYVASYHTDVGHYSDDVSYFATKGVMSPPLYAPAYGVAGANGVFNYGPSSFPSRDGGATNYWADIVYNNTKAAAQPVFNPPAGAYGPAVSVTLISVTPGAQIFYTMDGSDPTPLSAPYAGPIAVPASATVKAIAVATGWDNSPIGTASYTIGTVAPTFIPSSGTYSASQLVALTCITSAAQIYYTTDGSNPSASSTLYSGPISVAANVTVRAIAIAGGVNSPIASATYNFQAAQPTFSPAGGTYTSAQSVTLSEASPGAKIYYTTDGTTPTTSSTLYAGAIAVNSTMTINAIATVTSWANSSMGSASYTINLPPTAPGNLVATASSPTQISLTWADNSNNETGFKIERKTGAGGTYAQIATPAAGATSYNDSGLVASTTYYYRIRATNSSGDSGYSNEANTTTLSGLPAPWVDADIGSTGLAGSGSYLNGSFTVKGSGADIWGTADALNYVYQPITTNVEIIAKVNSVQGTDVWAKAGVMVRETLNAGSTQAIMLISSASGCIVPAPPDHRWSQHQHDYHWYCRTLLGALAQEWQYLHRLHVGGWR